MTLAAENVKNPSRTGTAGSSQRRRRTRSSSVLEGKRMSSSSPRLLADHAFSSPQKQLPAPAVWFMDMPTKTPSASSVTCADSTGSDESTAASAPHTPLNGKNDRTTDGGV